MTETIGVWRSRVLVLAASMTMAMAFAGSVRAADTFRSTGRLSYPRQYHTATLLPDGRVLVAGGSSESWSPLSSAETYDPGSGTWTITGSMAVARAAYTATLLPDGRVLVAGGSSRISPAEVYDPGSGTWTSTGSMAAARVYHTATLLPDGRVLVAGGYGASYLSSAEIFEPGSGTWTSTGSMAAARSLHTATLLPDGRVLVAGGEDGSSHLSSAEIYDPASGTWTNAGSMSVARSIHTATLLPDGRVLVAGGGDGVSFLSSAEIYDPGSATWASTGSMAVTRWSYTATLLADGRVLVAGGGNDSSSTETYDAGSGTWTSTGSMAAARSLHTATLLADGRVLVAGGWGLSLAETYDAGSGTWASTGSMSDFRFDHTATLLPDGPVLVAGGSDGASSRSSVEIYDAGSGTWASTGSMSDSRFDHTATLLPDGRVLVAGGDDGSSDLSSAEIYDPGSGTWTSTGPMASARHGHTATLLPDGRVLVAGGQGASFSAEIFDPVSGTWTGAGSMASARHGHTATLLPDGRVLVAGGYVRASAEVFDPVSGTWTGAGSMSAVRYDHTATLLPDGRVLVAGGDALFGSFLPSAEIYDPGSGKWTSTGPMSAARAAHTAALLPDGRVLVTGGRSESYSELSSAEVYDPGSGTWTSAGSMAVTRYAHTATLLPDGRVLVVGGWWDGSAQIYDPTSPAARARRPSILTAPSSITPTIPLSIAGHFRADSEASGGGMSSSAVNYPIVEMLSLAGGRKVGLSAVPQPPAPEPAGWRPNFWDDPMTLAVGDVPCLDQGWHLLSVAVAGIHSDARLVKVECGVALTQQPASVTVALGQTATFAVKGRSVRAYQWLLDGVAIPGATGSTYTTPQVTAALAGTRYSVVATGNCPSATVTSSEGTLTVEDTTPATAAVVNPSGGEYWLVSEAGRPANEQTVTWSMSDNIRVCRVHVKLRYSNDGGASWSDAPAGGGLPATFPTSPTIPCAYPGEATTSLTYSVPTTFPSGQTGSLYRVQVTVTDQAGLPTMAESPNPFFIVQPNPDAVRTLILKNTTRMQSATAMGVGQAITVAQAAVIDRKLEELAAHPRVLGLVVDLGGVTDLGLRYAGWDADRGNTEKANAVLFGCHAPLASFCAAEEDGIHDVVRELLSIYTGVRYVVVVGDDRVVPFARIPDQTSLLPESQYVAGGDLTGGGTTVGAALAAEAYLSDDPLGVRGRLRLADLGGETLVPTLAVGRLVETPEEITTAIATFIGQDGVLDLSTLNAATGHKVLVTGYDFLVDSGNQIAQRWKTFFPTVDGAVAPVDGTLIDDELWGLSSVDERRMALETHLGGNSGPRYGIASLNGHATHYLEGVPGVGSQDIQGLGADRIAALNLAGGVVYAVGCHGGLPVPGSSSADADHSLDLPQTLLSRGVVAYVANTGYGWGLKHGIGYAERLVQILTEEMTAGGTFVTGDAVKRTKQRYYLESPRYDVYDEKSLMQWTFFGLPMYAVKTGIAVSGSPSLVTGRAPESPSSSLGKVGVEATQVAASGIPECRGGACLRPALTPPPSYVTQLNLHFDMTASGVYRKWQASGGLESSAGCSDPNGCYYTLNGLVERSTGAGDLPVQPYFIYDSRLSGTSQHGVLWKGGMYLQESGWAPVFAQLESNGGDASDHGDLARTLIVGPVHRRLRAGAGGEGATSCPASDAEMSSVVVPTGESVRDGVGEYSIERTYRTMGLEVFYFNNTADGTGNCDREGPIIGAGPFAGAYHQTQGATLEWSVPVTDTAGVWRVLVVATDGRLNAQSRGTWESLELTDAGGGLWTGARTFGGGEQVTYVIQAVDTRGNVTWLPFVSTRVPASGVPIGVPLTVEVGVPVVGGAHFTHGAYLIDEGADALTLTVVRDGDTNGEATVAYATSDGTASALTDYIPAAGVLTFAAGESSSSLMIPWLNDTLAETDETLLVTLLDPVGVALGSPAVVTLTIRDDDAPSTLQFRQVAYSVEESGPVATIAVTRTGGLTNAVTIDYGTSEGTATVGRDYVMSSGEVYFRPGETEKTFLVPILADSLVEENETLTLTLSNPTGGATLGAQSTATLTIVDDERQVQFALAAISAGEGALRATVTVKRIGVLTGALTVEYFTAPGTATENVDYGATSGYLSFASGVVSKTFTIPLINDTLDEPNETILLGLRNVTGGVTGPINAAVLTILDNDVAGTLQFSLPSFTIGETGGAATITVTRSGGTASGVTVGYTTSNGTATAGSDYTGTTGTLTFDAAKPTATFVVPVTDDALSEGVETVNLTLLSPGGGGILGLRPTAVLSIVDDETALGIATPELTVTEGAAAAIAVRRTGSLAGAVTVPYTTTNGSATSGSDYTTKTGTLTLGNNVSQLIVSVPTLQDTLNEPDETFTLTLGTPTGSPAPPLGAATATVTIKDNDPAGSLSFSLVNAVVSEAIGLATVTVKRTGGTASGVTVHYATSDGTATVAQDYTHTEGTVSFAAGQAVQTFKVPILNDTTAEGAETIQLTLSAPAGGATLGTLPTALLTIKDNDGSAFRFGSPKYSVSEAGRLVTITVRREGDRTRPATVSYDVSGGTGQSGADFAVSPGTLSFAAGAVSRSFTVRVVDDTVDEADRTVALMLSAPSSGHHLGYPYEATLTITDDDRAGVVQFSTVLVSEVEPAEGETTEVAVAVTRSGGSSSGVTVDYATSDGTAEAGTDYVATSGTLTFGSGETRKTFTVTVLGDSITEGNETIGLALTNPTNGAELGVQDEATLWSVEESGAASLAILADSVMEAWLADEGGGLAKALRAHNYRAEVVDKVEAALGARAQVVVLPLRLASKAAYRTLLASLAKRPQTLFVLVTPPPLPEALTTAEDAARARAMSTWFVRDVLVGYKNRNVAVFDLFNVLTSRAEASSAPTATAGAEFATALSDAGLATGNHHRLWAGNVEHVQQETGDVSAYATRESVDDGIPIAPGLRKATEELLPLLTDAYNQWRRTRSTTSSKVAGAPSARAGLAPPNGP